MVETEGFFVKVYEKSKGTEEILSRMPGCMVFLPDADREIDGYPNPKSAGKNQVSVFRILVRSPVLEPLYKGAETTIF